MILRRPRPLENTKSSSLLGQTSCSRNISTTIGGNGTVRSPASDLGGTNHVVAARPVDGHGSRRASGRCPPTVIHQFASLKAGKDRGQEHRPPAPVRLRNDCTHFVWRRDVHTNLELAVWCWAASVFTPPPPVRRLRTTFCPTSPRSCASARMAPSEPRILRTMTVEEI